MQKFLLPMIVDVHRWFKSHIETNILVYQKSASSFITQLNHIRFLTKLGFFSSSHDIAVTSVDLRRVSVSVYISKCN